MKKEIITEPTQIIQFAEDIRSFLNANEYLKEDALFLDVGSPLRVSFHYWGNWGFAFDPTKQDCLLLYDAAQDAYSTEWMPTGNELNNLVAQAAINAGLGDVNKLMNKKVAEIAVDLIKDIPFGNIINIADIGTGTGAVVLEIVNLLGNDDNRLIFHLVEPSEKRLEQAEKELRSKGVQRIETYNCRDVEYNSDQADIVVSTAAIHHNSFLRQALRNVYEHMHPGAFFINGDWNISLWDDPISFINHFYLQFVKEDKKEEFVVTFTRMIGNAMSLDMLIHLSKKIDEQKDPLDVIANALIVAFWISVNKLHKERSNQDGIIHLAGIMPLESHQCLLDRLLTFREAGFISDPITLRRLTEGGDIHNYNNFLEHLKTGNVHRIPIVGQPMSNLAAVTIVAKPRLRLRN